MTMDPRLAAVLADLTAESDRLDALVAPLDDDGWRAPTPAEGWDIAHQIAHLAWTDETAVKAATDKEAWDATVLQALSDPEGFVDTEAARGAEAAPADLLERWRWHGGHCPRRWRSTPPTRSCRGTARR